MSGSIEVVKQLLDKVANSSSDTLSTELGRQNDASHTPLHLAAEISHDSTVEELIARGAEVDQEGYHQITPLLSAALAGKASTLRLLYEKGADAAATNRDGLHPLTLSANDISLMEVVVKYVRDNSRLDPGIVSGLEKIGDKAAQIAIQKGNDKVLGLLANELYRSNEENRSD